ncbi:MAG: HlyC/CorC family transporter [Ignavibacteriaceae bacterium]|jgi:putative hemolysin|nr:HlyC/CorC family transporter [Ignavibacteriales bacterium]MBP9121868.1 HlyC/CorC family transporter [Ignavibacteriaceae bacterium]MCC6636658.1 HlyC/CorC family transporter [Ignavibacteriaceae bacterium]
MGIELLFLVILVVFSAFFSSSEMSYIVANRLKIEIKAGKNNPAAQSAHHFITNPNSFYSTILIGNNIANITFASIAALLLSSYFGFNEIEILLVSTLIILFFGELIPKYLGRELGTGLFIFYAIPLRIIYFVLYPLVKLAGGFTSLISRDTNTSGTIGQLVLREELQLLIEESENAGKVNKKEGTAIRKLIDMRDQRVNEAMRPRTEIVGVEVSSSVEEVIDIFIESGFSKIPVYEENLDNIKGFVLAYDLFKQPETISAIVRDILNVPETKRSVEMLNDFLRERISIAVVIDEFGGTAGIVTAEDLIEEVFGEIKDEYDVEENVCRKTTDNEYLIGGNVEIDSINEKFDLGIPEGDYNTVGGFIMSETGRIPAQGEILTAGVFKIHIIRSTSRRIEMIKLSLLDESQING